MRSWVVNSSILVLIAAVLVGCGGGTPKPNNTVAQVRLLPDTLSIVAGDVAQIQASAVNSTNGVITTTFTFNSSNNALATVSPSGLVCGGVWDSSFITCKGTDSGGNPLAGTAVITASAGGVSSAPVQVAVHPSVTSITIDPVLPPGSCFSIKQTHAFVPHAFHNGTDITSLVGNFTWTPSVANVASIDANGLATALAPGLTGIIATLGSTTSPAANFKGCLPVQIRLHVNLSTDTSATLSAAGTAVIQADMVDENNVTTASAPVAIVSNNNTVASVAGTTLTGNTPGGAGLLAVCAPPNCGVGLNLPIYSNLFQVVVSSFSPATFVYATTSFAPPSGTTPTLIPIDTTKTVAGTAINLPGVANSLVFTPSGTKAYLGTSAGLASLDVATNTVTLVDPFVGKVLAISGDGNTVIESNAANDPGTGLPIEPDPAKQRVVIANFSTNSVQSLIVAGAVAASFTGDGFKAFIVSNNGNVSIFSPQLSLQTINIPGVNNDVATLSSGPFVFVANSTAGLQALGTCNNATQSINPTTTSTPQFVQSIRNADVFVAVNATGLDVETATVTPLTPQPITALNCTPNVSYSNQPINFGIGAFTAHQLLVPSNGLGGTNGSHIVVLPAGINKLLVAVPGSSADVVSLGAGATEPLSGGLTLDGNTAWIGMAGSNTVDRIDLTTNSDNLQIATSFKKSDNSAAPPNIVAVQPK